MDSIAWFFFLLSLASMVGYGYYSVGSKGGDGVALVYGAVGLVFFAISMGWILIPTATCAFGVPW